MDANLRFASCGGSENVTFTIGTFGAFVFQITAEASTSETKPARNHYVDAPPPAVNSWGKGPPKLNGKAQDEPKVRRDGKASCEY